MDDEAFLGQIRPILDGAASFFSGYIARKAIGLLTTVMLARVLTMDSFGILIFGLSVIGVVKKFGKLGSASSFLKLIPKYVDDTHQQHKIITIGITVTAIGTVVSAGALFWYAPQINELSIGADQFPAVLKILSVVMILEVFIDVCSSLLRSMKRPRFQVIIKDGIKPLLRNGAILTALYLGSSVIGVATALAIGFAVGLIISVLMVRKVGNVAISVNFNRKDVSEFLSFSIPLTFHSSASILYKQIDIFMIGLLLASADVSVFKVGVTATTYLILPTQALNQIFTPISSELYEKEKYDDIATLYHVVTRWALTLSLLPVSAVLIFRHELISIFGSEYIAASGLVVIFVIREFIINSTGPSGQLLVMMNRQNYQVVVQWVFGILNVTLNYILILWMGVLGAAIATVSTTVLAQISRVVMVWYLEDMQPFRIHMIKPFISLIPATIGMYYILTNYNGLVSLIFGTIFGGVIYLTGIYLMGLEDEDKLVFSNIL